MLIEKLIAEVRDLEGKVYTTRRSDRVLALLLATALEKAEARERGYRAAIEAIHVNSATSGPYPFWKLKMIHDQTKLKPLEASRDAAPAQLGKDLRWCELQEAWICKSCGGRNHDADVIEHEPDCPFRQEEAGAKLPTCGGNPITIRKREPDRDGGEQYRLERLDQPRWVLSEVFKDGSEMPRVDITPHDMGCGPNFIVRIAATLSEVERLREALDPDALEAIADEIDCFEHSARAASLRVFAKEQRAALEGKSDG